MKISRKNNIKDLLREFSNWEQHFLAGTNGAKKTDVTVVEYVKSLLNDVFAEQPDKVKNCKLAPWLLGIVESIGPENIDTLEREKMIKVAKWFKTNGTEGPFKGKNIEQAFEFVVQKELKSKPKEEPSEKKEDEDEPQHLQAEKDGRIVRIARVGDGSGRIWVEVKDGSWLGEPSESNPNRAWGIQCQANSSNGFQDSNMLNVSLIGPPNGDPKGPWSTQLAIAGPRGSGHVKETKQEGNQQPGSQNTSGGYKDGAELLVNFLCNNSFAKENFNTFALYHGGIPNGRAISTYGGDAFLTYLSNNKPELFNKLMDCRPDVLQNNKDLILALKGLEWFEERELKVDELVKKDPMMFIQKFDRLIERWGQTAVDALREIDLADIYSQNPDLIKKSLSLFVGRIPKEDFVSLFKKINLEDYISSYPEEFKKVLKFMSNEKNYKDLFDYVLSIEPKILFSAFGQGIKGVLGFIKFASSPRLRDHQDAVWDDKKEEWWRNKKVPKRDESGQLIYNADGTRVEEEVKSVIPENLLVMDKKELKKFIYNNKDFIDSVLSTKDFEKKLSFLKIMLPLMSIQEAKKILETDNLKGQIIDYYNKKYKDYKSAEALGQEYLYQNFARRNAAGEKILQSFQPGILEFYRQFKFGKPEDRKIPLPEIMENAESLKKYFASESQRTESWQKQVDGYVKLLEMLKDNGAPEEELVKMIEKNLKKTQESKTANPQTLKTLYSEVLNVLSRPRALSQAKKLEPFFNDMGETGKRYFKDLMSDFATLIYDVKPGDLILYKGNSDQRQRFRLSVKKYLVIEVRNTYKDKDLAKELLNDPKNIIALNGEVLVTEDDSSGHFGQTVWVPTERFEVRSKKEIITQGLNESLNRFRFHLDKLKRTLTESSVEGKPRYTAIMLDGESMSTLQKMVEKLKHDGVIGEDWKISADHVTINMGSAKERSLLGQQVNLTVDSMGSNEMVVALKVSPDRSLDFGGRVPHITLAFNKNAGAKPVMSNQIKDWKKITPIKLKGNIEEVF